MQSSGGKIKFEDVSEDSPVLLFLYGDDYKVYGDNYEIGSNKKTGKTAEEILSDQELMNSFEMCNVFYCVIE
jgi:hypothetical protein